MRLLDEQPTSTAATTAASLATALQLLLLLLLQKSSNLGEARFEYSASSSFWGTVQCIKVEANLGSTGFELLKEFQLWLINSSLGLERASFKKKTIERTMTNGRY